MHHIRISGTENLISDSWPNTVAKSLKSVAKKVSNQALAKRNGVINP